MQSRSRVLSILGGHDDGKNCVNPVIMDDPEIGPTTSPVNIMEV